MNIKEKQFFGEVEGYRFGFGPIGPPLMSVYLYCLDGIVIDSAQSHMRKYVLAALKGKKIEKILLTHHHEDHSGNASAISKYFNVNVYGNEITAEKMKKPFKIKPYQTYTWGKSEPVTVQPLPDVIETGKYRLRPVYTPGHSRDHTVYLEEKNGWLFAGDLYLGDKIKFFRSDENFHDQITSLKMILKKDFDVLLCAHNPTLKKGKERLANKLSFLEDISEKVSDLRMKGYSERKIIKILGNDKDQLVRYVTLGNVSFAHMLRSAMQNHSK
jgi:glyoxylase-like metal-dependent hydrolase (beta-lactamase superfamily II)